MTSKNGEINSAIYVLVIITKVFSVSRSLRPPLIFPRRGRVYVLQRPFLLYHLVICCGQAACTPYRNTAPSTLPSTLNVF
jgi:hypothetical protein